MAKYKKGLFKEKELYNKLANLNETGIAIYYENLLKKMFKAVKENDYLTLGNLKETLRKSIFISSSKVKNFNILFDKIKIKVLTEELANYIDVEEIEAFNFINIKPEVEEARKVEDPITSLIAYHDLLTEFSINNINNEDVAVNVVLSHYRLHIKGLDELQHLNNEVSYSALISPILNPEVFIDFVKNAPVKDISNKELYQYAKFIDNTYVNDSDEVQKANKWDFEGNSISETSFIFYAKYNESFIVLIDENYLEIIEKESYKVSRYAIGEEDIEFLIIFSDYCLGLKPNLLEVKETDS